MIGPIPQAESDARVPVLPAHAGAPPSPAGGAGAWEPEAMVLLVEDEPLVRELIEGMLRRGGYEVLGVGSGEEALAAAPSIGDRLALVLADMSLPGINGKETVRRLRSTMPHVRAIHMSGNPGDRANEHEAFVSKPFSRAQLLGTVAEVIGTPAK